MAYQFCQSPTSLKLTEVLNKYTHFRPTFPSPSFNFYFLRRKGRIIRMNNTLVKLHRIALPLPSCRLPASHPSARQYCSMSPDWDCASCRREAVVHFACFLADSHLRSYVQNICITAHCNTNTHASGNSSTVNFLSYNACSLM